MRLGRVVGGVLCCVALCRAAAAVVVCVVCLPQGVRCPRGQRVSEFPLSLCVLCAFSPAQGRSTRGLRRRCGSTRRGARTRLPRGGGGYLAATHPSPPITQQHIQFCSHSSSECAAPQSHQQRPMRALTFVSALVSAPVSCAASPPRRPARSPPSPSRAAPTPSRRWKRPGCFRRRRRRARSRGRDSPPTAQLVRSENRLETTPPAAWLLRPHAAFLYTSKPLPYAHRVTLSIPIID